jgi:hypothetical protein
MLKNAKTQGPVTTLVITDEERKIAAKIKDDFKAILKTLDQSVKITTDLKAAVLEQHPSKEDLKNKYSGRFLRYRRKITSAFNGFLSEVKGALNELTKISDPEMIRLI